MKSSIYISSEKIDVIGYAKSGKKIAVKEHLTTTLPEGTMINGKIIERGYLVERLHTLYGKNPKLFSDSTLVVDGSSIFSKRLVVPKLSKRQCEQYVRDDFADTTDNAEDLVCDYYPLEASTKTNTSVLACAVDEAQINSYISACTSAGIKLKAIRVGVQSILSYVSSRPDLKKQTFVLNLIDGMLMLSMIFENGVNVFMSRTRLYSDDYEQLIQSMLENLSGLIQFNRSQNFNDITYSYYLGLTKNDLNLMSEISPYPGVQLAALDIFSGVKGAAGLPDDLHFAYLNALLGSDGIDLIQSRKKLQKHKKRQRKRKYWIPALLAVILLLAVPTVHLSLQASEMYAMTAAINSYLTDEAVSSKSAELDGMIAETSHYNDVVGQMNGKIEWEQSMPQISGRLFDLATQTLSDKVTVAQLDFNSSSGILRVTASSATGNDSAAYVDALKKNSLVKDIKYVGYNYDSEGKYNFSIDITLAAGEEDK